MYYALVGKLEDVRAHPNADRIKLATCFGSQVVVSLDAKDDDIVLFFDSDGQLSEDFCKNNNLYDKSEFNLDQTKKGYFSQSRRIRAQTFRGAKSEAFVIGLNSLDYLTGRSDFLFDIGDKFYSVNGIEFCNKYITPETIKQMRLNQPKQLKLNQKIKEIFKEHIDTEQLRHVYDENLLGVVTYGPKYHGTSQRSSNLLIPLEKSLPILKRAWNVFVKTLYKYPKLKSRYDEEMFWQKSLFEPEIVYEYQFLMGTRRVCKGVITEKHTDYRAECHRRLQPHILKGETWFYEIVGWENPLTPIMPSVDLTNLQSVAGKQIKDELVNRFGNKMTYKYSCHVGKCEIYVYRITTQNEDGEIYELPFSVVKDKCNKAGIKHVEEIETRVINTLEEASEFRKHIEHLTDGVDIAEPIDPSHIREGIVIRVQNLKTGKCKWYKSKTLYFKICEGLVKDTGVVDTEEAES